MPRRAGPTLLGPVAVSCRPAAARACGARASSTAPGRQSLQVGPRSVVPAGGSSPDCPHPPASHPQRPFRGSTDGLPRKYQPPLRRGTGPVTSARPHQGGRRPRVYCSGSSAILCDRVQTPAPRPFPAAGTPAAASPSPGVRVTQQGSVRPACSTDFSASSPATSGSISARPTPWSTCGTGGS